MWDNILLLEEQIPNEAPVVSMSDANLAILSGMTLKAGESLESLVPTLLSMIDINDAEDGSIAATQAMLNVGTLSITAPEMGTYSIEVIATDSEGKASLPYTFTLSIVTVINDFEAYADDAAFKAEFSFVGFRTSGSSWLPANGQLVTIGEENVLQSTYGSGTNGIRINVTKAQLEALGAEYIGIRLTTSAELSGTISFQAFTYDLHSMKLHVMEPSLTPMKEPMFILRFRIYWKQPLRFRL
jgi:hypothetical protein